MSTTFKPILTPALLNILNNSLIAKTVSALTGHSIDTILNNCNLEVPEKNLLESCWLLSWDVGILPVNFEHIYQVQMLLKQVWLFSHTSFDSPLYKLVANELTKFETEELHKTGPFD